MDINDFVKVRTIESVTKDFVARIVARRKALRITQKTLALRSGVSYATIRRFEHTGAISIGSLFLISNVLYFLSDFDNVCVAPAVTNLKEYKPS